MVYTLQVSDHAGAGARIPTAAAGASWRTVYDGPLTYHEARRRVNALSTLHPHARAFRGTGAGLMVYAVLTTGPGDVR